MGLKIILGCYILSVIIMAILLFLMFDKNTITKIKEELEINNIIFIIDIMFTLIFSPLYILAMIVSEVTKDE